MVVRRLTVRMGSLMVPVASDEVGGMGLGCC